MALCQLNASWNQILTTTSLKSLQANDLQVFEGRMLQHLDLRVATERKAQRGLEELATLVLQHKLAFPKRSNGHEDALADVDW